MTTIKMERIYDSIAETEGIRILVDRLWPRGISKEDANLDYWLKELGPSNELRKDFDHDDSKFNDFKKKYKEELKRGEQQKAFTELKDIIATNKNIILLYAAKDTENNNAQVLKETLGVNNECKR